MAGPPSAAVGARGATGDPARSAAAALPYHAGMPDRRLLHVPRLLDIERGVWLDDRRLLVDPGGRIEAVLGSDDSAPTDAAPLDVGEGWSSRASSTAIATWPARSSRRPRRARPTRRRRRRCSASITRG